MIPPKKNRPAIKAIHNLMIRLKINIVQELPHRELYNLIDELEYLPILLLNKEDRTQEFEEYLKKFVHNSNVCAFGNNIKMRKSLIINQHSTMFLHLQIC